MFLIWGVSNRTKNTHIKAIDTCTNCHNTSVMNMVRHGTSPTIFFIPIGSFNNEYYLQCPHCGAYRKLNHKEHCMIKDEYRAGRMHDYTKSMAQPNLGQETIVVSASQNASCSNTENSPTQNRELIEKIKSEIDYIVVNQTGSKMNKNNPNFNNFMTALINSLTQRHGDKTSVLIAINEYFK